ncbi:uncharacterized protein LOC131160063 [Malania oleifera]|uniref:uncharacterized protein LOC131160063 n=1 Tax=Malania oleifera TaxID=397392 RepID=UPI0025AE6D58|nr:uncharacterized protein LOC131160063 [Malania oleifera]
MGTAVSEHAIAKPHRQRASRAFRVAQKPPRRQPPSPPAPSLVISHLLPPLLLLLPRSQFMVTCSRASHFNLRPFSLLLTPRSTSLRLALFKFNYSLCPPNKRIVFASLLGGPNRNSGSRFAKNGGEWNRDEAVCDRERGEGRDREVQCEVEVISWRERRIKAEILVNADVESVWNALTDYEKLADFIPNLVCSGRIPCPHPGGIWLEQRGLQRALYWHIEARVVLDLQEFPNSFNDRELHFSMVDGDFKKFEGKWCIRSGKRSTTTNLSYEVNVIPRFNFPTIFLERIIRSDLPVNLQALSSRAEIIFEQNYKMPSTKCFLSTTSAAVHVSSGVNLDGNVCEKDKLSLGKFKKDNASSSIGPLHPSATELSTHWGIFGKFCKLDRHCMVDEVHLRRFDGLLENGGVHRCVVATITVKAPVREVWNVMTAYERLPEIVPNLAISKIISRENNKVRIVQEGCKGLLYMVLHARVVLDLCERLEQEISFEQVEGDFDAFQGKWLLEQLGNHHTLLKYSVESRMHKDSFLSEAIMEEVIYEDLPSNLSAIRDYIEEKEAETSSETCDDKKISEEQIASSDNGRDANCNNLAEQLFVQNNSSPSRQRPRVPGLQRDMKVLKSEILAFISEHGQEGFMPMRKQLRKHGRGDIENAIKQMGGFTRIASLMNLSLAYKYRKPKGYWDNLENLKEEISQFQKNWGMDPSFMPSRKSFERAGRYDIARALEKWGGLLEVSRLLSLKVRHRNRWANLGEKKSDNMASNEVDAEEKAPCKSSFPQDKHKWLMKPNHLNINSD